MANGLKGAAILRGLFSGGPIGAITAGVVASTSGDDAIRAAGIGAPANPPLFGVTAQGGIFGAGSPLAGIDPLYVLLFGALVVVLLVT